MQVTSRVVALLALGAVLIGGGFWWWSSQEDASAASWLFSHTADGGTLEEQADGTYRLTLTGIDPHVLAFTDRPIRDTSIMGVQALADGWDQLFAASSPNAVLVEHNSRGDADSVVLVLSDPEVTGDSLTYSAQVLNDENASGSYDLAGTLHSEIPGTFEEASLFIDDVMCPPDSGPTSTCAIIYTNTFIPFNPSY